MRAICSLEAKIDEARLVGMKCEPIPRKPLVQDTQNPGVSGRGNLCGMRPAVIWGLAASRCSAVPRNVENQA